MNILKKAREFDRLDKPREAAEAYEEAIRTADAPLDVYVDLVALYFVCGDYGYYNAHNLPLDFVGALYDRMVELAAEVERKFGYNSEIDYWVKYHDYILFVQDKFAVDFEKIAKSGDSPVPYMTVFLDFGEDELARKKAMEAYLMSKSRETARKRYIYSILSQSFGE